MPLRLIFNTLAIAGAAMFSGVMLAVGMVLGGYWKSLPSERFLDWFSENNHFIMRAIPIVVIPTLVGLIGSAWLSWGDRTGRNLWLAACGCIIGVLFLTLAYYVPSNARFAAKSIPLEQVSGALNTWLLLHDVRIALAAIASVLGVIAMSRNAVS